VAVGTSPAMASLGLVMSMAKSALAVQVTFNPEVARLRDAQSHGLPDGEKRLLATLCYALLDPESRELLYASAGHSSLRRLAPGRRPRPGIDRLSLGVRGQLVVEHGRRSSRPATSSSCTADGSGRGADRARGRVRLRAPGAEPSPGTPAGGEGMRDGVLQDIEPLPAAAARGRPDGPRAQGALGNRSPAGAVTLAHAHPRMSPPSARRWSGDGLGGAGAVLRPARL